MRLAFVLMQKSEGALLKAWIEYHARFTNRKNIFIYDNGSHDQATVRVLKVFQESGGVVITDYNRAADYQEKDVIVKQKISDLQISGAYDFVIPLDADEFLITLNDQRVQTSAESVDSELNRLKGQIGYFKMKGSYYNCPGFSNKFFFYSEDSVFFGSDPIISLDHGYHRCATASRNEIPTNIAMLHFQFKRFDIARNQAVDKLRSRVEDFSAETMATYRGKGSHMTRLFTMTAEKYEDAFSSERLVDIPEFELALSQAAIQFPKEVYHQSDRYALIQLRAKEQSLNLDVLQGDSTKNELLCICRNLYGYDHVVAYKSARPLLALLKLGVWTAELFDSNFDALLALKTQKEFSELCDVSRLRLHHVDIGTVDPMGYPTASNPGGLARRYVFASHCPGCGDVDALIIAGRYRAATCLAAVASLPSLKRIAFANFWSRAHYHIVLRFCELIDSEGDLAILTPAKEFSPDELKVWLTRLLDDPR